MSTYVLLKTEGNKLKNVNNITKFRNSIDNGTNTKKIVVNLTQDDYLRIRFLIMRDFKKRSKITKSNLRIGAPTLNVIGYIDEEEEDEGEEEASDKDN